MIAELAKGLPVKVRRLYAERNRFDDQKREIIQRMMYLVDKGETLVREEAELVNVLIAEIHGQQL